MPRLICSSILSAIRGERNGRVFRQAVPVLHGQQSQAPMGKVGDMNSELQPGVVHCVSFLRVGGMEQVVKSLVTQPCPGTRQSVCVLRKTGIFSEEIASAGVKVYAEHLAKGATSLSIVRVLLAAVRRERASIVHCHDLFAWQTAVLARIATGGRLKVIFTKHGHFEQLDTSLRIQARLLAAFTSRIVAVSEDIRQEFQTRLGIGEKRVDIIVNGIDTSRFQIPLSKEEAKKRLGLAPDSFVAGSVTRFFPVKNIEMQVDMVERLSERLPKLRYVLVAPLSELGDRIIADAQNRKLSDRILFLGRRQDIPELLRAMDVFILSSHSEGTSMALLEAMAAGCPAVVSRVGGNAQLVQDGANGFLFQPGDLDEMCRRVTELHDNPGLHKLQASRAVAKSGGFGFREMARRYQELYGSVLKNGEVRA